MLDEKIRALERRFNETGAEEDLCNLEGALRELGQIRNLTQTYASLAMACDPILIHPQDQDCFSAVIEYLRSVGIRPEIRSKLLVHKQGVLYAAVSGNRGGYRLIDLAGSVEPEQIEGSFNRLREVGTGFESFRRHIGWTVIDPPHRDSEGALLSYQLEFLPKTARKISLAVCREQPCPVRSYKP